MSWIVNYLPEALEDLRRLDEMTIQENIKWAFEFADAYTPSLHSIVE